MHRCKSELGNKKDRITMAADLNQINLRPRAPGAISLRNVVSLRPTGVPWSRAWVCSVGEPLAQWPPVSPDPAVSLDMLADCVPGRDIPVTGLPIHPRS